MYRKPIYVMAFVLVLVSTAQAGMYVWNGSAGDGLWETPGNWTVTDSVWTWPNEENTADPNANAQYINLDTLAIDIIYYRKQNLANCTFNPRQIHFSFALCVHNTLFPQFSALISNYFAAFIKYVVKSRTP